MIPSANRNTSRHAVVRLRRFAKHLLLCCRCCFTSDTMFTSIPEDIYHSPLTLAVTRPLSVVRISLTQGARGVSRCGYDIRHDPSRSHRSALAAHGARRGPGRAPEGNAGGLEPGDVGGCRCSLGGASQGLRSRQRRNPQGQVLYCYVDLLCCQLTIVCTERGGAGKASPGAERGAPFLKAEETFNVVRKSTPSLPPSLPVTVSPFASFPNPHVCFTFFFSFFLASGAPPSPIVSV